jgi:hypothetical protein
MKIQELEKGKCYHCKRTNFYIKVINKTEVIEVCNASWASISRKPIFLLNYFEFEEADSEAFEAVKEEVLNSISKK